MFQMLFNGSDRNDARLQLARLHSFPKFPPGQFSLQYFRGAHGAFKQVEEPARANAKTRIRLFGFMIVALSVVGI